MKRLIMLLIFLISTVNIANVYAQNEDKSIGVNSELEDGLDLLAVCELFKESQSLEEFEKSLNNPDVGVNNLDLNDDLDVDYIRVVEEIDGDVRFIVLQVPLGYEEFQDVAVIEVVRVDDDNYKMEIQGDEVIYGQDYFYVPAGNYIGTWTIIPIIFLPNHAPFQSDYHYGYYPLWWKPYRYSKTVVYHTRISKYQTRKTFVLTNSGSIKNANNIHRVSAKSNLVRKRSVQDKSAKIKDEKMKKPISTTKVRSSTKKKDLDKKEK